MILGTGSLLPPLETGGAKVGGREGAAQARLEERMVKQEPTLDDTRALLEANLFHHELITDDELQLRHQNSIGPCFEQFVRRHAAGGEGGGGKQSVPLWQRYDELKMPLLLIYGRDDRGRAAERVRSCSSSAIRSSTCTSPKAASTWCRGTQPTCSTSSRCRS